MNLFWFLFVKVLTLSSFFLRYDYSGYGQSTGKVRNITSSFTVAIDGITCFA